MCLLINLLLIPLLFLLLAKDDYLFIGVAKGNHPDDLCQQQLELKLFKVGSSLNTFYDQKNRTYPIQPPIKLEGPRKLQIFLGQILNQLRQEFPTTLVQFDVVHQGDDRTGYQLIFYITFYQPPEYPIMVDWTPVSSSSPRRQKFQGNGCADKS